MSDPGSPLIRSLADLSQDLARRHRSGSAEQPVATEVREAIAADFATLERQGFVIIERVLAPEQCEEIRAVSKPFLQHRGRNNFEGLKTQRIYNVLEKTRIFDQLAIHPRITGLLDRLLLPNYLLSQAQVINIEPGEAAQPLHFDEGMYRVARPRAPLGAATIWAINEFTAENGATVVIPGSHRLGNEIITDRSAAVPAVMPQGSVIFFLGTLWHGGGENRSRAGRLAMTCQYCEPWLRQQENFFLELSDGTLRSLPERLLSMVGYSIHAPLMGMVNGMHPKRAIAEQGEHE